MEHVAIMNKNWNLIPKILDGRKQIESRWGKNKSAPFGKVSQGDVVYFKNSGEPVVARAWVKRVIRYENLNLEKIKEILAAYGGEKKIAINDLDKSMEWVRDKRYCTLIFLKNAEKIKPFLINKKGFGIGAAWLTVKRVKEIRLSY